MMDTIINISCDDAGTSENVCEFTEIFVTGRTISSGDPNDALSRKSSIEMSVKVCDSIKRWPP